MPYTPELDSCETDDEPIEIKDETLAGLDKLLWKFWTQPEDAASAISSDKLALLPDCPDTGIYYVKILR